MVAYRESAELAKRLIEESCKKQGIQPGQLTLHADRGTSMRSKPVALLLADLGVTKTHSRPHVSDDNPYSESQFRTLKYRPGVPGPLWVHRGQPCFLSAVFPVVQRSASSLRRRLVDASGGSLWSSRKLAAATPGCARCCLPASPGALRTKRSQTTDPSQCSLDQQAGFHSGTAACGRR